jgi:hypothetical protein
MLKPTKLIYQQIDGIARRIYDEYWYSLHIIAIRADSFPEFVTKKGSVGAGLFGKDLLG